MAARIDNALVFTCGIPSKLVAVVRFAEKYGKTRNV